MSTIISTKTSGVGGLSVTGDASGILQLASADGTTALTIDASQNVGIGTSSPSYRLEVKGASATAGQLSIHDGTGDTTVSGATAGSLLFQARDSSIRTIAEIDAVNTTTNGTGSAMVFQTRISDALAERMRIDSSGNVGIGTSSPNKQLQIQYGSTNSGQLQITNNSTGTTATDGVLFGYDTSNDVIINNQEATATKLYTSGTERMRIDSSGNLLVGTTGGASAKVVILTTGNASASMAQTGTTGDHIYFRTSTNTLAGYITSPTGTTVSYISVSDQRIKENIVDAPSALASVNAIKVRSFDWKADNTHQDYGYIAQELLEVAPEAVSVPEDSEQMMGVDFGKLTPRLVKSIQELKAIIDTQNARIEALENN